MSDIENLAKAATELGNHVAAVVRLSNVLTGILKDGNRGDIDDMTRRVILRAVKELHDEFRERHFRGLLDTLNAVVTTADRMYQAEPAVPGEEPVVQLADIPEDGDAAPAE